MPKVGHVVNVVFDIITNSLQRFMPDASVLFNPEEMQPSNKSCARRLLKRLGGLDTFTADVYENILELVDVVEVDPIND